MLSEDQLRSITELVAKYEALPARERQRYQETEVRTNFIDPLFAGLGWPMQDREHVERETTVLDSKRPDYIFKIAGVPRLFLEAKRFREDIYDQGETRKAITKAYNKGVAWVGVTNFERLVLYDAHEELKSAQPSRVLDLSYTDYIQPGIETGIDLLAPDALQKRELEQLAQRTGARRRSVPIERRLYESMRRWRQELFNALFRQQRGRTGAEVQQGDEAIQRLLDRLIFLRNCEDRGIAGTDLRGLRNRIRAQGVRNVRVTESLLKLFAGAAHTYDSELFQAHAIIDDRMQAMGTVLDEPLSQIIEQLYSVPRSYSDYDFSQMEPDVLGEVYEQYLGYVPKLIRNPAARALLPDIPSEEIALEAKRQRRKEHGIYYTPRWVVQYIVRQTLGRFLEENKDRPDAIDDLTILDPACGSGSFLIRAYETLLEHHAATIGGDIGHLDTRTRERILHRNIYGVDLDPQAVEIARLNLLMRMVSQQELLPELKDNIQHGNSLIEGDEAALHPFFGDRWQEKHPFSWQRAFPDIMERGGFDIVIGNPPYVNSALVPSAEREYHRTKFLTATGKYDLYMLFMEKAIELTKNGGYFSFIVPNKFMYTSAGKALRDLLSQEYTILALSNFDDNPVFTQVTNYPCILVLTKRRPKRKAYVHYVRARNPEPSAWESLKVPQGSLTARAWTLSSGPHMEIVNHLSQQNPQFGSIASRIATGIQTGADRILLVNESKLSPLDPAVFRPILRGRDIKRYAPLSPTTLVFYPFVIGSRFHRIMTEEELSSYPNTMSYLRAQEAFLRKRVWYDKSAEELTGAWYGLMYVGDPAWYAEPKIVTPALSDRCNFTLDHTGLLFLTGTAGGYGLTLVDPLNNDSGRLYAMAVLNSSVTNFCIRVFSPLLSGGFYKFNTQYIERLPFPHPTSPREDIIRLAKRMCGLHQRVAAKGAVHDYEREKIERDIASTDREIDNLVYDLYGLAAKERALIEAELRRP